MSTTTESKIEKMRHTSFKVYFEKVFSDDVFNKKVKSILDFPQKKINYYLKWKIDDKAKALSIDQEDVDFFTNKGFIVEIHPYNSSTLKFLIEGEEFVTYAYTMHENFGAENNQPCLNFKVSTRISNDDTSCHKVKVKMIMDYLKSLGFNMKYVCEETIESSHECRNGDA